MTSKSTHCGGIEFDESILVPSASLSFGLSSLGSIPTTSRESRASVAPWPERGELPMTFASSGGAKVYKDPVIQWRIDEENFVCRVDIQSWGGEDRTSPFQLSSLLWRSKNFVLIFNDGTKPELRLGLLTFRTTSYDFVRDFVLKVRTKYDFAIGLCVPTRITNLGASVGK